MHNKKGQIAVFIIIAIVIVLGILLLVFVRFNSENVTDSSKLIGNDRIVYELENCIDLNLKTAVQILGLQGGYLVKDFESIETSIGNIAIVYSGTSKLLSINQIEGEISNYLEKIIPLCLEEDNYDFEFEYETRSVRSTIKSDEIEALASIYITIDKDDSTETIDLSHKSVRDSNFKDIYDAASDIVLAHSRDPEYVDISLLSEYGYDISFISIDNYVLYIIKDEDFKINEVDYSFTFGVEK